MLESVFVETEAEELVLNRDLKEAVEEEGRVSEPFPPTMGSVPVVADGSMRVLKLYQASSLSSTTGGTIQGRWWRGKRTFKIRPSASAPEWPRDPWCLVPMTSLKKCGVTQAQESEFMMAW